MIPKVIHYCWFGEGELTPLLKKCINSWKKYCPDYEIIEWNESNFDVNSNSWTKEAYKQKKFAFVSDYVRLFVLYKYGGVYLDTDIEIIKGIDNLLTHDAFTGFESGQYIQTGIIGSTPNNSIIKKFLNYYNKRHFVNEDGSIEDVPNVRIFTEILKDYGLTVINKFQSLNEITIYPQTYFCPIDPNGNRDFSKNTYCIHHFTSTWRSYKEQRQVAFMHKWYYPIYRKFVGAAIKSIKLFIGNGNARKLHTIYKERFSRN